MIHENNEFIVGGGIYSVLYYSACRATLFFMVGFVFMAVVLRAVLSILQYLVVRCGTADVSVQGIPGRLLRCK